jgi:hypothetical protein
VEGEVAECSTEEGYAPDLGKVSDHILDVWTELRLG